MKRIRRPGVRLMWSSATASPGTGAVASRSWELAKRPGPDLVQGNCYW